VLSLDSIFAINSLACKIIKYLPGHHDRNPKNWVFEPELLFNKKKGAEVHQALHLDFPAVQTNRRKNSFYLSLSIFPCVRRE
jgi:hypothetical protein